MKTLCELFVLSLISIAHSIHHNSHTHCPISKHTNLTREGYFYYPTQLYTPLVHEQLNKTHSERNSNLLPCYSVDEHKNIDYTCPSSFIEGMCPILNENVKQVS